MKKVADGLTGGPFGPGVRGAKVARVAQNAWDGIREQVQRRAGRAREPGYDRRDARRRLKRRMMAEGISPQDLLAAISERGAP